MQDSLPFLRTIIANPEDDAPRLVFADYLDEIGEHERARFIRVQCGDAKGEQFQLGVSDAAAGIGIAEFSFSGPARWSETCPVLVEKGPKTWNLIQTAMDFGHWKLLQLGGPGVIVYHRGFIRRMHLPPASFFEHAATLLSEHPIEFVRVNTGKLVRSSLRMRRSSVIPDEVWEAIRSRTEPLEQGRTLTEEFALQVVSEECIRIGRKLAGI